MLDLIENWKILAKLKSGSNTIYAKLENISKTQVQICRDLSDHIGINGKNNKFPAQICRDPSDQTRLRRNINNFTLFYCQQ